jgi:hypothetical protein
MALVIFTGNDNLITLDALFDLETAAYVNNATVTGTLFDRTGSTVVTFAMAYVAASNGKYQGVLLAATTLVAGTGYRLDVAVASAATGLWQIPVTAQRRES